MNYYKRHIGDYAAKAGHLTMLEHGAYGLLMDAYYNREKGPTREEAMRLARARSSDERAAVDAVLAEFFTEVDGEFIQNRIEDELAAFHAKQEANRILGARGGLANAKRNAKRIATETLSESEANGEANDKPSHKPLAITKQSQKKKQGAHAPTVVELLVGVDSVVVADFTEHRRKLGFAITETGLRGIIREAAKAGLTLEAALQMICERGWRSFKAEWVRDSPASARAGPSRQPSQGHNALTAILGVAHEPPSIRPLVSDVGPRGTGDVACAEPRRLPGE